VSQSPHSGSYKCQIKTAEGRPKRIEYLCSVEGSSLVACLQPFTQIARSSPVQARAAIMKTQQSTVWESKEATDQLAFEPGAPRQNSSAKGPGRETGF